LGEKKIEWGALSEKGTYSYPYRRQSCKMICRKTNKYTWKLLSTDRYVKPGVGLESKTTNSSSNTSREIISIL